MAVLKMLCLGLCLALVTAVSAVAQPYPSRPVKMVVSQPPGAASDLLARAITARLTTELKQQVIVENKPGAGGLIAIDAVIKSPADGYTLFTCTSSSHITLPLTSPNATYRPLEDFTPIASVGRAHTIIVVPDTSPFRTFQDLLDHARRNPGKLSYASAGVGTMPHLVGALIEHAAGVKFLHVPYRGTPEAEADLIGGRVDFTINNIPPAISNLKAGRTRALAAMSANRPLDLPEVPTVVELGMPNLEIYSFLGICGPAGIPADIVDRLQADIRRSTTDPQVSVRLAQMGLEAIDGGPKELASYIRSETERWGRVIEAQGLTFD